MFPSRLNRSKPQLHTAGTESVCPFPLQFEESELQHFRVSTFQFFYLLFFRFGHLNLVLFYFRLCNYTTYHTDTQYLPCSEFTTMIIQSYTLNKTASGFDGLTSKQIQDIITTALIDPASSQDCAFSK